MVPDYYTRKQTLANAERYITPELKELEDMILGAEDKLYALEYELYCGVRDTDRVPGGADPAVRQRRWPALDALASLALVAERNGLRPSEY